MRIIIASVFLAGLFGAAQADSTTFNSVPANIADAPVKDWRGVERRDQTYVFRWRASFRGGVIWIAALHPGRYWEPWRYQSESKVLEVFKKNRFENFRRIESAAYAGSQWGYISWAERNYSDCIVGVVLDNGNHSHDGSAGGTLRGYVEDCGTGAKQRFDDWLTWFRSFKRVPLGYNALLDR